MIAKLKHTIEDIFGHGLNTSADYEALSQSIHQRVHIRLLPTTLKRIFGYLHEDVTPRRATLDILAQYVGYRDYDAFAVSDANDQSALILSEKVVCSTLPVDQLVRFTWPPDRDCTIRHEGDGNFSLVEAKNTKLCVGDTFTCHMMIQHEPLYLDCYHHKGLSASSYVVARVNGVTFQLI